MNDQLERRTVIVVMGVAGAGKTTVGQMLAAHLRIDFVDADSLHPADNIAKMTRGVPLTDADRAPWLQAVHNRLVRAIEAGKDIVVACSALKQRYRNILADGVPITWVFLKGSEEQIRARLGRRTNHFMKPQMLASQFADLEPPEGALVIDAAIDPAQAVQQILASLEKRTP